ncbi:hypothetical protein DIC66_01955 [Rhodoferax lacus]|uniref:O-antigen ligase-related domain-containing protein n=1 Tax=Rhodoferax lacus TaxID=2184758 RepID=A0A3E1RHE9_9BURK|nr:O-antigen ligase family protein [Rhodoferax lacus]RFO98673.1 hypothetical protein DIC66_01955 [Rhodoferax lacus]
MIQESKYTFKNGIYGLFLLLFAIFPISNTIALRNVLIVLLTGAMLVLLVFGQGRFAHPLRSSLKKMPWPILLWVGLLLLFPLWAREAPTAWHNLGGQWLEALLAGFIGYAAFHLLGRNGPGLLALGYASAVPLLLHLLLCIAATQGLLDGAFFANPTIATLWNSLRHPEAFQTNAHWTLSALMKGFRGIEPMHGNLGYPACQSICLFCAALVQDLRDRRVRGLVASSVGIALCFLSILIAQSRGAILYAFLIMLVSISLTKVRASRPVAAVSQPNNVHLGPRGTVLGFLAALVLLVVTFQYAKNDPRWFSMTDSVVAAFAIEDPSKALCEGLDPSVQEGIRSRLADRDAKYVQAVIDGLNSDGGRILVLRAGFQLMLENPVGLDGSRQSYRKLIKEKCGHEPVLQFAHSHNSWIDLTLALGWVGTLAFACLMGLFFYRGLVGMRSGVDRQWAMALVLVSCFWILRGVADSVYREHYLQMQFMLLMYLFGRWQFAADAA